DRARAYGVAAGRFDDGDVLGLHARAREAVEALRSPGTGPIFLECVTYRWREHVGPGEDFHLGYRDRAEAAPFLARDACRRLAAGLAPEVRERIEAAVRAEVEDAIRFAEESPFPSPDQLYADLYATGGATGA